MRTEKELALATALKHLLIELKGQGVDMEQLTESVAATLFDSDVPPDVAAQAVIAIEVAADALVVG